MMTTTHPVIPTPTTRTTRTARHTTVGYAVAIGVNLLGLYVAHHLLVWGWPAFLTQQYDQLLPIITLSIVATIVANVAFLVYDAPWFKSLANAITAAIAFVVALRTYQVFPFDFSSYAHDWSTPVRLVIVLTMAGASIGCLVESIRFLTWPLRAARHER
jgi:hypothetical protein